MDNYPPLPSLTDQDLVLAVFTHESLNGMANEEYGESKRLAQLGERVFEQAMAFHYFKKEPVLSAEAIEVGTLAILFPSG
jgi:dsRNA-specific ribonuclease